MVVFLFLLQIFVLFLINDVKCNPRLHSGDEKIVGGFNTDIAKLPYQVYLLLEKRNKHYYQCGGSIINEHTILTAAHCLVGVVTAYIRIGTSMTSNGGNTYISYNFTTHPNYNRRTSDYDVGIIRPLTPMRLRGSRTRAIRLPEKGLDITPGTKVLVSGWGATSETGSSSGILMAVEIPVVSNEECRRAYRSLTERMFCAGISEGGKDSCQGDSGGPAVSKRVQIGIVSFGLGCARKGYPGVYTRVSDPGIRDWIEQVSGV